MKDPRIVNLLAALIEETSRGRLTWFAGQAPGALTYATNDVFFFYAEADFKGTRFAIYDLRYRYYYDEHEFSWNSSINLSVLDNLDRVLWQVDSNFPEVVELYDDVRRKLSGIDGLLDQFR